MKRFVTLLITKNKTRWNIRQIGEYDEDQGYGVLNALIAAEWSDDESLRIPDSRRNLVFAVVIDTDTSEILYVETDVAEYRPKHCHDVLRDLTGSYFPDISGAMLDEVESRTPKMRKLVELATGYRNDRDSQKKKDFEKLYSELIGTEVNLPDDWLNHN